VVDVDVTSGSLVRSVGFFTVTPRKTTVLSLTGAAHAAGAATGTDDVAVDGEGDCDCVTVGEGEFDALLAVLLSSLPPDRPITATTMPATRTIVSTTEMMSVCLRRRASRNRRFWSWRSR